MARGPRRGRHARGGATLPAATFQEGPAARPAWDRAGGGVLVAEALGIAGVVLAAVTDEVRLLRLAVTIVAIGLVAGVLAGVRRLGLLEAGLAGEVRQVRRELHYAVEGWAEEVRERRSETERLTAEVEALRARPAAPVGPTAPASTEPGSTTSSRSLRLSLVKDALTDQTPPPPT